MARMKRNEEFIENYYLLCELVWKKSSENNKTVSRDEVSIGGALMKGVALDKENNLRSLIHTPPL